MSLPWYRSYTSTTGAPAIRSLSDREFRVFTVCQSFAGRSPSEDRLQGALTFEPAGEPVPVSDIAYEARATADEAEAALETLRLKRLIERREDGAYRVLFGWDQYKSDGSTSRVRKHRQNKEAEAKTDTDSEKTDTDSEQNRGKRFTQRFPERSSESVGGECVSSVETPWDRLCRQYPKTPDKGARAAFNSLPSELQETVWKAAQYFAETEAPAEPRYCRALSSFLEDKGSLHRLISAYDVEENRWKSMMPPSAHGPKPTPDLAKPWEVSAENSLEVDEAANPVPDPMKKA